MPENPMSNIEDQKAQLDMGVMAVRVFQGALSESEDFTEAFFATCALFRGMFGGPFPKTDEEDDKT